jgi:hypothetical protein
MTSPPGIGQVRLVCQLGGFKGTLLAHPGIANQVRHRR